MWVQIAGITNLDEVLMIEKAGADSIGFVLESHEGMTKEYAKEIISKMENLGRSVLITYLNTAKEVKQVMEYLGLKYVQLHAKTEISEILEMRKSMPWLKIVKSVNVKGMESIEEAKEYEEHVDYILLDTQDPETGKLGATGKTHDWDISRKIVKKVEVPVILAGGLNPDNIEEAIKKTKPFGVDVHTGVEGEDGLKSEEKVKLFIERAKGV
ncbi:MAG: phosphoribosylanthranilate isomerase [Candidatus Aenigmarchaeota archaeon]|nr:phosphoribosylanthranilate isomerase [Candidatus Aenigmarchaeota archaeon]MCK4531389.1 phosphoribosylanthranilate isomerase [Candidatus Aenigmarchaeota archaeon]